MKKPVTKDNINKRRRNHVGRLGVV